MLNDKHTAADGYAFGIGLVRAFATFERIAKEVELENGRDVDKEYDSKELTKARIVEERLTELSIHIDT